MTADKKHKVVFFGTPLFAATGLKALLDMPALDVGLVITQPDKPAGRGGNLQAPAVKELALENSLPVFQPGSLRKQLEESIEKINQYGPFDTGVVIAFGQILPQAILDLPRSGCVNVHASLLPRWRGAAPIQRAIMSGDKETGICLMKMDAGLDTGAVYSSSNITINPEDNFQAMHDKLAALGAALLKRDIIKITNGELDAVPQKEAGLTYADKIKQEEARLNWNNTAVSLHDLIRALSPSPAAYCFLEGKRLKIFKSRILEKIKDGSQPGQVSYADKTRLEVTCRDGVLSLEELQLEGKRRMPAAEFLNGVQISTETILN